MTKFWTKQIFFHLMPCLVLASPAVADVAKYEPEVISLDFNRPVATTNGTWACEQVMQRNFVNNLLVPKGTYQPQSPRGFYQLSPVEYESLTQLILQHSLVKNSPELSEFNRRRVQQFLGRRHVDIFHLYKGKTLFQWAIEADPEGTLAEYLLTHMERKLAPPTQTAPTRMPELFYDLAHSFAPISVKSWAVYFRSAALTIDDLYHVPAYRRDRSALDTVRPAGIQIVAMIEGAREAKQNAQFIEDLQAFR